MSGRSYSRLPIEEFGRHLLLSGDLDPVYIALGRVEWPEDQLHRWLVAYWCLYHPGASSWLSEQQGAGFWEQLTLAAANSDRYPAPIGGRWPRAAERRHWRGHNALSCVEDLKRRYPAGPEGMVEYISNGPERAASGVCDYAHVKGRVMEHVSFGPWIAFKVADMLERCCGVPVNFAQSDVMYEDPQKAALNLWKIKAGYAPEVEVKDPTAAINQVVTYLVDHFKSFEAPPGGGRRVDFQEVETILCKWKSHMNGHYPLNNDLHEIRAGALPWAAVSQSAVEFLHYLPLPTNPAPSA